MAAAVADPAGTTSPVGTGSGISRTAGFGTSVALTGGSILAVGSPGDPNRSGADGAGSVWIYRDGDGTFVTGEDAPELSGAAAGSAFGQAVAFSDTGSAGASHLLVGAPGSAAGGAFRYEVGDTLSPSGEYAAITGKPGDRFGTAVAVSTCAVGSWGLVAAPGYAKAQQDGGGFLFVDGEPTPKWMDAPAVSTALPVRWGAQPPDFWKKYTPEIPKYLP